MKKVFAILTAAVCSLSASALGLGTLIPIHIGVGANVGTNGIGIDAGVNVTRFLSARAGFSYMPQMKFSGDANLNSVLPTTQIPSLAGLTVPSSITIEGKPDLTTGHVLVDVYPLIGGFHITAGAYFGQESIIQVYNQQDGALMAVNTANNAINTYNTSGIGPQIKPLGVQVGDYLLTPDAAGNVMADVRVNKVRPYIGIGYGHAVPRHLPVGVSVDLGVQYWGTPKFYCNDVEIQAQDIDNKVTQKIINTASKIPVYPVLTIRVTGKIF